MKRLGAAVVVLTLMMVFTVGITPLASAASSSSGDRKTGQEKSTTITTPREDKRIYTGGRTSGNRKEDRSKEFRRNQNCKNYGLNC